MFSSSSPNETHTMIHCHCNHHWVILITCKILSRPIEYFVTDKLNHKLTSKNMLFEIKREKEVEESVASTNKHIEQAKEETCKAADFDVSP